MRFSTLISLLFLFLINNTATAAVKIASYSFDESDWHLTGSVLDSIGGHHGVVNDSIGRHRADAATAHPNTCASASFGGGSIDISGLPVSTTSGDKTSVSFWMYWDGTNSIMPIGWNIHDLWMINGSFGFNTGVGDVYGISSSGLANGWHHVVAEFTNNNVLNNKIYIDGVDQILTQHRNSPNNARAIVQPNLRLGGWFISTGYRFSGFLDEVKIYNGALTQAEVNLDLNYIHTGACPADPAPQPEQLIASYNFNDDWSSTLSLVDSIGTADGNVSGSISKILSPASGNKPETCTAGDFDGGAIDILNLPVSTTVGDKTSISFWMNWDGTNSVMPLGWNIHDLWFYSGHFGFNTGGGDIYGIASDILRNTWHHVTVVFTNNSVVENKIYIDGIEQTLTHRRGTINNSRAVVHPHLRIGGWWVSSGYRFRGQLDEIKIYTGEISQATIDADRTAISNCYTPLATWHMDEVNWNGIANEVIDETTNNYHGTAQNGTATSQINPAIIGDPGSCGLGQFDGVDDYIALPSLPNLTDSFTLTTWVKSTKNTRGRIFSDDDNNQRGYALSLNEPSSGKLRFYSRGISPISLDTSAVVLPPDNNWYFVSAVHDASTKRRLIYVNGILMASGTYTGTWGTDSGIASIGNETNASSEGVDFAPFGGSIDEMQIFESALSQRQIQQVMAQTHACPTLAVIDHFELSYSSTALTCTPSSVTIKACTNADCSALYTPDVDVTLSPATGWAVNPVTISNGSVTLNLTHTVAEIITLDVSASSIVPTNPIQCIKGPSADPSCSIDFSSAGFVFDVSPLTACKTSADITIRAVKKSDTGVQCVGALAGTQSIDFWSTYISPNTGTQEISISGTNIATSSPGTAVDLFFNINGEATYTATYDDAGQLQLNARHITVDGLVLEGDDTFVSKPVMLATFSDDSSADCPSGDASCSKFKKAGELFNLKVNAACWTHDADTDFTDNPVTPNFELIGITTAHNLVTPIGGSTGTRSVSNFNFVLADKGSHTISQSVSEVGVFTFSLSSVNYFGEALAFADSPYIGRFYPDHFEVITAANGNFSSACSGFSYSGQVFTYQTKPQLNVTAYNAESPAVITQNYTDSFAKLVTTDFNVTAPITDASQLGADATNLVRLNWAADVASLTDNGNGQLTFSFGNDRYAYLHEANSRIAPFSNVVDLIFTAITDSDNVQTTALPYTLQPAGEPIRFGRLNIANTHGSELAPLPIAIKAEFFNGINWVNNSLDQCTALNLASHIRLSNAATSGGSLIAGTSSMNIASGTTSGTLTNNSPLLNGEATLTFSAPGEDNQGYVDIHSRLSATHDWLLGDFDNDGAYDDEASGRASFGLFKGSDTIIFRREVY
ncbi:MAG: hypothetical protein COB23_08270 [Methylophaga sp.]|nr:MAG: hypothetical protein COB23_08270 [Methylophaga sp.]